MVDEDDHLAHAEHAQRRERGKGHEWKQELQIFNDDRGVLYEHMMSFLSDLEQEQHFDKSPFGNPSKRLCCFTIHLKPVEQDFFRGCADGYIVLKCPQIQSGSLTITTLFEHDHSSDQSKKLKIDQASSIESIVSLVPSCKQIYFMFLCT